MVLLTTLLAWSRVRTRRIKANKTVEFNRELLPILSEIVSDFFRQRGVCVLLVFLAGVTTDNNINLGVINLSNKVIRR
jgi:hypothetical protein